MAFKMASRFSTSLGSPTSQGDTRIELENPSGFPELAPGDESEITLSDPVSGDIEEYGVTGREGAWIALDRPLSRRYPPGASVSCRVTPSAVRKIAADVFEDLS